MNFFCPVCGSPATQQGRFCGKCGCNLESVRQKHFSPSAPPPPEKEPEKEIPVSDYFTIREMPDPAAYKKPMPEAASAAAPEAENAEPEVIATPAPEEVIKSAPEAVINTASEAPVKPSAEIKAPSVQNAPQNVGVHPSSVYGTSEKPSAEINEAPSALKRGSEDEVLFVPVSTTPAFHEYPYVPVTNSGTVRAQKKPRRKLALILSCLAAVIIFTGIITGTAISLISGDDGSYPSAPSSGAPSYSDSVINISGSYTDAPDRTVMIYIVAADLESKSGAASLDLDEILKSSVDTTGNNILIYAGGTSKWKNHYVEKDKDCILQFINGSYTVVKSTTPQNMGKSKTLSDFMTFCKENYPAEAYDLILWNHGGGPLYGYGVDENFDDNLSLEELSDALAASPFGADEKLELLGFDACLMGSLETAWIFRDYAEYFVGSQETEPGRGWDYTFLGELQRCSNGGELGTLIVESYYAYYERIFKMYPASETEITLSCTDLSVIDEVEDALETLFGEIDSSLNTASLTRLSKNRYKTKCFGKFTTSENFDLVDLKHLATLLTEDYPTGAQALLDAVDAYVVCTVSNVANANGVSLYHPYDVPEKTDSAAYIFRTIDFAPRYTSYIRSFSDNFQNNSTLSFRTLSVAAAKATTNGGKSDLSLQLTDEQLENLSGAHYYIFRKLSPSETFSGESEYLMIFSGQDVTLSADGKLNATYQGKAVFGKDNKTNEYSSIPLSMNQIYDGSLDEKFYFPCMFWHYGEMLDFEAVPANWLMKIRNGTPQLLEAYDMLADENNVFPDKFLLNAEDYDAYTFANNSYMIESDADGNSHFIFTGSSYGFEYKKADGFTLELRPIDYNDEYYAVFVIEDIYGNTHNSALIRLGQ